MTDLLSDEHRAAIGASETSEPVAIARRDIVKYAIATEQRLERYRRGDEAPPMFLFGLFRPLVDLSRLQPDGLAADPLLPDLPLRRTMAGGTKVACRRPIRAGDVLTATRTLVDISERRGRSGPLIFVVYETRVEDEAGRLVAVETQTRIAR